jgi:SAM-dependent methyltransferase
MANDSLCGEADLIGCPICGASGKPEFVFSKDGFEITKCPACGVGRTIAAPFEPEELYTEDYFNGGVDGAYRDYEGSQKALQHEFHSQVQFLASYLPEGGKLLEVGCAYGFFLQEAKSHFDVYGLEVAQSAVDFCRRNNLPNVRQSIVTEEFLSLFGPFDAIVLLDVIEHIDDVPETMRLLLSHLRDGGVLMLTTGDWGSLSARLAGKRWRLLTPPLHLWFFTSKSLRLFFARMHCRVEHLSYPWKMVPLELILSQVSLMLGVKWAWKLPAVVRNAGLPANLFDAIRMVVRKTGKPA